MTPAAVLATASYAVRSGFADYALMYTWRSWLVGWLARVLSQVAYFSMMGHLIGSPTSTEYLLIGNAVAIAVMEGVNVVGSTTWERRAGTLPLLVASPRAVFVVFAARSVHWVVTGTATAVVSLLLLSWLFGVVVPLSSLPAVVPLVLLVAATSYCLGLVAAALVLPLAELRNVVAMTVTLVMLTFCGVQVPAEHWPSWVRWGAHLLPLTDGLAAVRLALAGGPTGDVLRAAGTCALVGVGWLVVAALLFHWFVKRGRHDGSIEFGN